MPKKFRLTQDGDIVYECKLKSKQCKGQTPTGVRCQRKVVIGLPYCFSHTRKFFHLSIRESTIAGVGKGVFAWLAKTELIHEDDPDLVFKPGNIICPYMGEKIDKEELDARYPGDITAPYVIALRGTNKYEDAACERGIGSIINHKPKAEANAQLITKGRHAVVVALKNIYQDEEIFVFYSAEYEFLNNHTTK